MCARVWKEMPVSSSYVGRHTFFLFTKPNTFIESAKRFEFITSGTSESDIRDENSLAMTVQNFVFMSLYEFNMSVRFECVLWLCVCAYIYVYASLIYYALGLCIFMTCFKMHIFVCVIVTTTTTAPVFQNGGSSPSLWWFWYFGVTRHKQYESLEYVTCSMQELQTDAKRRFLCAMCKCDCIVFHTPCGIT